MTTTNRNKIAVFELESDEILEIKQMLQKEYR